MTILPSQLKNSLIAKGYSEDSANIITAQYFQKESGMNTIVGTEKRTIIDVQKIVETNGKG
jgi:hypothetical protein